MNWIKEAQQALSKVPFFVRNRVKKRVEEEAKATGAPEVNLEHVQACKRRFLSRMEEEVRGYQVETCFGQSGCPNRAVKSDGIPEAVEKPLSERKLKTFLKDRVEGPLKMHHGFRVSVSDCPNACSRPQIVDLGLIGACEPRVSEGLCTACGECVDVCQEKAILLEDGTPRIDESKCVFCGQCIRLCPAGALEEGRSGYRILVGGKLGRHPRLGKELPGIHTREGVLEFVDRCLNHYQRHCLRGERLGEILERTGVGDLESL